MKKYQPFSASEIQIMLEQRNYWLRIHNNKLLSKIQASKPSRMVQNGTSLIITFYDGHLNYLCTMHQVVTNDGHIIHENVKDAYLDGIWYKAKG